MICNIHKSKNKKGNRKDAARLVRYPAGKTKEHAHKGEPEKDAMITFLGSNMDFPDPTSFVIDGQIKRINCKDADWSPFVDRLNEQIDKNDSVEYPLKHFSISLAPGENMTSVWWEERYNEFMLRMGYEHCPSISFKHGDTDLEHIHITVSTIQDLPGNPIVDQWQDKLRAMAIMRDFEQRYGLTAVCDPVDGQTINNPDCQTLKADLRAKIDFVLNQQTTSGQVALPDLIKELNHYGVGASIQFQNGAPKGISYSYKGSSWAGGKLGGARRYAWPGLYKAGVEYDEARDKGRLERQNATEDNRRKGVAPLLKARKLPDDAASKEVETQSESIEHKTPVKQDAVHERVTASDGLFWMAVKLPKMELARSKHLSRPPNQVRVNKPLGSSVIYYLCKNKSQVATVKMIEAGMNIASAICELFRDDGFNAEEVAFSATQGEYTEWQELRRYRDPHAMGIYNPEPEPMLEEVDQLLFGCDGGGGGNGTDLDM